MENEIVKPEVKRVISLEEEKARENFEKLPLEIRNMIIKEFMREKGTMTRSELLISLPPDVVPIIPAPKLWKLNCQELCSRTLTITNNITEVTEFSGCIPTNAEVISIYGALNPISEKGMNLTDSNKILKKVLFPQLRRYLTAEILSCAGLAHGDRVLFGEIGVPVKGIPVKYILRLPAPQHAFVNTKKGRGLIQVGCEVIPHAIKGYCIAFGDPEVDPDLWMVKIGGRIDFIPQQVPGTSIGWQKAAIGRAGVGYFSETVVSTVPFS